jgi:hypothetical protein
LAENPVGFHQPALAAPFMPCRAIAIWPSRMICTRAFRSPAGIKGTGLCIRASRGWNFGKFPRAFASAPGRPREWRHRSKSCFLRKHDLSYSIHRQPTAGLVPSARASRLGVVQLEHKGGRIVGCLVPRRHPNASTRTWRAGRSPLSLTSCAFPASIPIRNPYCDS